MREFELVDAPQMAPWGCVICKSARGPLVDTYYETPLGRVYVCKLCAKRVNRTFGFTPGARLDELDAAASAVVSSEQEMWVAQSELERLKEELRLERNQTQTLAAALEASLGRERARAHLDDQVAEMLRHRGEPVRPVGAGLRLEPAAVGDDDGDDAA